MWRNTAVFLLETSNMNSHNCNSPREDFVIFQLSIINMILKTKTMKTHLKVQTIWILLYCCVCWIYPEIYEKFFFTISLLIQDITI